VIAAAWAGRDDRGYGMSSVRFNRDTQDIHRRREDGLTEFLRTLCAGRGLRGGPGEGARGLI
jgi:hypothetical protein